MSETIEAPVLTIGPVQRNAAKFVIGLVSPSGGGKTYTALQIALGLANMDPTKVGLLDTENRRGSLYADIFPEPFLIGDMPPPFSPDRYRRALRQFAEHKIEALVIDSMSHEHEGEGGIEEIAEKGKRKGRPDWLTAKREHKRFMNTLLFLPCHVICCFRGREKMDFKKTGPNGEPLSLGIQPVTEKNVLFEMTASFLLSNAGLTHEAIKLPENLKYILEPEGYYTPQTGMQLREFVGGKDELENARNILRLAASEGLQRLGEAWSQIDKKARLKLADFKETLKETARHADDERIAAQGQSGERDDTPEEPTEPASPAKPEERDAEGNFKF